MKKLSIQNLVILINNEKINITSLEIKSEKYILYSNNNINDINIDLDLFAKMQFKDEFQITPKKKYNDLQLKIHFDSENKTYSLLHNNNSVYYLKNYKNIIINNDYLHLILFNGTLLKPKNIEKNNLVDDILSKKTLKVDEKNISDIKNIDFKFINNYDNSIIKSDESNILNKEISLDTDNGKKENNIIIKNKDTYLKESGVVDLKEVDLLAESKNAYIKEKEVDVIIDLKESDVIDLKEMDLLAECKNPDIIEVNEIVEAKNDDLKEENLLTESKNIDNKNADIKEVDEIVEAKNDDLKEVNLLEEIKIADVKEVNLLAENKNADVKESNVKLNENIVLNVTKCDINDNNKEYINVKNNQLDNEIFNLENILSDFNKLFQFNDTKIETKVENKITNVETNVETNVKTNVETNVETNVVTNNKNDLIKLEPKKLIIPSINNNIYSLKINYQNSIYNINAIKLISSNDLNFLNLYKSDVPKKNIIHKFNLTFELEKDNSSYLINFMNIKYLINKINNMVIITNLYNKNSQVIKNKDNFKLGTNDFILYNDCSIIIPMIAKKIFDNNYGTSYNLYMPIV